MNEKNPWNFILPVLVVLVIAGVSTAFYATIWPSSYRTWIVPERGIHLLDLQDVPGGVRGVRFTHTGTQGVWQINAGTQREGVWKLNPGYSLTLDLRVQSLGAHPGPQVDGPLIVEANYDQAPPELESLRADGSWSSWLTAVDHNTNTRLAPLRWTTDQPAKVLRKYLVDVRLFADEHEALKLEYPDGRIVDVLCPDASPGIVK